MPTIQEQIRSAAGGGSIKLEDALQIAKKADDLLADAAELLQEFKTNTGEYYRGKIDHLVSRITNKKTSGQVYYADREPDGQ